MPNSLGPIELYPARILCPWSSPGKNIRVGLPFPSPGDLPNPGIKSRSPTLQADSLPSELPGKQVYWIYIRLYQLYVDCLKPVDKHTDCESELREIKF